MKNKDFSKTKNEDELDKILDMVMDDAKSCIEAEEHQRKIILKNNLERNKINNYSKKLLLIDNDPEYLLHIGDQVSAMGFTVDMMIEIENFSYRKNMPYKAILVRWLYFDFVASKFTKKNGNSKIYVLLLEDEATEENKAYFLNKGADKVLGMPLKSDEKI